MNWAKIELLVDYAIWKLLRISPEQTHLITASIDFGRRVQWLRALLAKSDFARKGELLTALNVIQNDSKRNIFSHSYLSSDQHTVTFIERVPFGKFRVRPQTFNEETFKAHVDGIADHAMAFQLALGASEDDCNAFAQAAVNMASSSTTSPADPPAKA